MFSSDLTNFLHFDRGSFGVETVRTEELLILKKKFNKPDSVGVRIDYITFEDSQKFFDSLGPPSESVDDSFSVKLWYFRIPDSDQVQDIYHIDNPENNIMFINFGLKYSADMKETDVIYDNV